jgi:FkbM family methyltransferase
MFFRTFGATRRRGKTGIFRRRGRGCTCRAAWALRGCSAGLADRTGRAGYNAFAAPSSPIEARDASATACDPIGKGVRTMASSVRVGLIDKLKRRLVHAPLVKQRILAAALEILKAKDDEIPTFLDQLESLMLKAPERYLPLLQHIQDHGEPTYRFKPREADKYKWIQDLDVRTVLDVGAAGGESVDFFHGLFPAAHIVSFEPLVDAYRRLESRKATVPKLTTFNVALGATCEQKAMNRSEFSPSSSLLKMQQVHKDAFPFTAGESSEMVEVRTLDSVVGDIAFDDPVLLKIDVQGFEEQVLMGARETLKRVTLLIIELSFVELYAGSPSFDRIYKLLTETGFVYLGSWHQLHNPKDGRVLQQNAIFTRLT